MHGPMNVKPHSDFVTVPPILARLGCDD